MLNFETCAKLLLETCLDGWEIDLGDGASCRVENFSHDIPVKG